MTALNTQEDAYNIRQIITNTVEGVEKSELSYTADGYVKWRSGFV